MGRNKTKFNSGPTGRAMENQYYEESYAPVRSDIPLPETLVIGKIPTAEAFQEIVRFPSIGASVKQHGIRYSNGSQWTFNNLGGLAYKGADGQYMGGNIFNWDNIDHFKKILAKYLLAQDFTGIHFDE